MTKINDPITGYERASLRAIVVKMATPSVKISDAVSALSEKLGVTDPRSRFITRSELDRGKIRTRADFTLELGRGDA